jgi:hypothetical protein
VFVERNVNAIAIRKFPSKYLICIKCVNNLFTTPDFVWYRRVRRRRIDKATMAYKLSVKAEGDITPPVRVHL